MKELPPPKEVLEMEPEELAPFILRYLKTQTQINRYNFTLVNNPELYNQLNRQEVEKYAQCLMEAWMYLERQGFVAPKPGQMDDWAFITRKGQKVVDAQDFETYN